MKKLVIILLFILLLIISFNLAQHAGMSGGIINIAPFINISNISLYYPNGTIISRNESLIFTSEYLNFIVGIASPLGDKGIIDVFVAVNGSREANCRRDGTFLTNMTMNLSSFNMTLFRTYVDNTTNGSYYQTFYNNSGIFTQLNLTFNNGSFLSLVIDAGSSAQWNNISWVEGLPYQEELPNNNSVETALNGANMSGNVLLFHMNEQLPNTIDGNDIKDTSGYNHHGNESGGVNFNIPGRFNTSIGFDGFDDFIDVGEHGDFNFSNSNFSIEVWIKPFSLHTFEFISTGSEQVFLGAQEGGFGLSFTPTFMRFGYQFDNVWITTWDTPFSYQINQWYHVILTRNGNNWIKYINGVKIDSQINSYAINVTRPLHIGADSNPFGPTRYFNGSIDELAIYNRTLSQEEILNHYKKGILNLNITVRSCDDVNCINDPWNIIFTFPSNNILNVPNNRYFQFNATFFSEDINFTPELYNVTINFNITQLIVSNITIFNLTGTYFNCTLTAEPNMTGNMSIGLGILDYLGRSTIYNLTYFWFNPRIGDLSLAISNIPINFPFGFPGQTVYYGNVSFTNIAENNLCLRVLMSGRDMYGYNGTAICPVSNVLSVDNVRYYANSSIFNFTGNVTRTPSEIIPGLQLCPGQSITINFSLSYPIPCVGQFNNSNALRFFVERVT